MSIADSLKRVHEGIARACQSAGRSPQEVTLVAVSKTFPLSAAQEAYAAGQLHFGENRVQEYTQKQPGLPQAHWHLIGQLQTNKVKYIADTVHLLHTLDSEKLAAELHKRATRPVHCLLQVNISDEGQKNGLSYHEVDALLEALPRYPQVQVRGLMGIAELTDDRTRIGSQFAALHSLWQRLATQSDAQIQMQHLSMGMSGDYDLAIAEGSTMVRIGSAIFGGR